MPCCEVKDAYFSFKCVVITLCFCAYHLSCDRKDLCSTDAL